MDVGLRATSQRASAAGEPEFAALGAMVTEGLGARLSGDSEGELASAGGLWANYQELFGIIKYQYSNALRKKFSKSEESL